MLHNVEKYVAAVKEQIEIVKNTPLRYVVHFHRHTKYNGKVEYVVSVHKLPDIGNAEKTYYETFDTESFTGKEKKQAKAYAKALAEKYGVEIREE